MNNPQTVENQINFDKFFAFVRDTIRGKDNLLYMRIAALDKSLQANFTNTDDMSKVLAAHPSSFLYYLIEIDPSTNSVVKFITALGDNVAVALVDKHLSSEEEDELEQQFVQDCLNIQELSTANSDVILQHAEDYSNYIH